MTVAVLPQTLSIDEAVDLCWEHVFTGEFNNGAEAARALWHDIRLSQDTIDWLALEGFAHWVVGQQASVITSGRGRRPAIGWGSPHGKKFDRYIALTWPFVAADGSQKPLLEWTADDLAALGARAGEYVQRWVARQEWAAETADLLTEHSADVIYKLPSHVLATVNEKALNVMGRDQA